MPLELQPVQQSDISRLVTIYFHSFQNPLSLACWPRTPNVRKAWEDMIRTEIQDSSVSFLKIVDHELTTTADKASSSFTPAETGIAGGNDSEEDQSIVAWAKWVAPKYHDDIGDGDNGKLPPEPVDHMTLPEEADKTLCDETFKAWGHEKVRLMGSRPHWYLELIATHPQHRGRGAAKMLMEWGIKSADQDDVEAYTEALPDGVGLYERYGFEERAVLDTKMKNVRVEARREVLFRSVFMIRTPNVKTGK